MRIAVEQKFLSSPDLISLGEILGDHDKALGVVVKLWCYSQDKEVIDATEDQINHWTRRHGQTVDMLQSLIDAYLITPLDNGLYHINGNGPHVEKLQKLRANSKKGGQRTKERYAESEPIESQKAIQKAGQLEAIRKPIGSPTTTTTTTTTPLTGGGIAPAPTDELWWAYSDAYEKEVGWAPIDNDRQRATCDRILKGLGGDLALALKLPEFYVGYRRKHYAKNTYALGILESDLEKLTNECKAGVRLREDLR